MAIVKNFPWNFGCLYVSCLIKCKDLFRLRQDFTCDMWSEANEFCHATVIILIRLKPRVDISWNPWALNIRDNQLFRCYYRHGVHRSLSTKIEEFLVTIYNGNLPLPEGGWRDEISRYVPSLPLRKIVILHLYFLLNSFSFFYYSLYLKLTAVWCRRFLVSVHKKITNKNSDKNVVLG